MTYTPPIRDMQFVLHELLEVDKTYAIMPPHQEVGRELIDQVLEEGGKFCAEVLHPLNRSGDEEGCTYAGDGVVTTPMGFREAWRQFAEAGWPALSCDPAYGGQGLPHVVQTAFQEMLNSANQAWTMYPGLTHGAYNCLRAHGTDAQKSLYLPKMVSGAWTGTMCLTEPHCGTDLGLLRTKAVKQADGTYKISGTKIFISAGEHDMTSNIIHAVLARIEGAPKGTKGISLFIVPKILVNADGTLGAANAVSCGSIEKKMGLKGSATCVMNFDAAKVVGGEKWAGGVSFFGRICPVFGENGLFWKNQSTLSRPISSARWARLIGITVLSMTRVVSSMSFIFCKLTM